MCRAWIEARADSDGCRERHAGLRNWCCAAFTFSADKPIKEFDSAKPERKEDAD